MIAWGNGEEKLKIHFAVNRWMNVPFPVSTRRRFDVITTLSERRQRCYNVKTTSLTGLCNLVFMLVGNHQTSWHLRVYSLTQQLPIERDETNIIPNITWNTWKDKKVVSCSIHCLHSAVVTPIRLPHSTDTGERGWLGASFTTSSMDISSMVYTATTSRAPGRVLTTMLSKVLSRALVSNPLNSLHKRCGDTTAVTNL